MADSARRISRRSLLISGLAAARLGAGEKGTAFPSEWRRFSDPTTEFEVYRLTDPAHTSMLPAPYCRAVAHNSGFLLFCSDRFGPPQVFQMDLKQGDTRQLTETEGLDTRFVTLTPDNRSFCYLAGGALRIANLSPPRERELYRIPEGWECAGLSVAPDGSRALLAERRGEGSRLRVVPLGRGAVRTIVEVASPIAEPVERPGKAQILYRRDDRAIWLVNPDGKQNRQLNTAPGRLVRPNWAPDGKTILYLNIPDDPTQLNAIREYAPEGDTDKLVSKTSQFVDFGFNRDASVFVGASRNAASPTILLLLRVTRRELTLCEHRASRPEAVEPVFSPDSQRIYFQSDRSGKPAIYCMHVDKLVEKTE
jgi:Tol biopolymer transport system component